MEVINMSPPPTSPTKGDDLCGVNVTDMVVHSGMLLLCLCGVAGNGAVVRILRMNHITSYIFKQAFDDFLFLLFAVPSTLLFLVEDVSCSTIMSPVYVNLLFLLSLFSYNMGLHRLMFIIIERCRATKLLISSRQHLSEDTLRVVMRALKCILFYAVIAVNPTVTSLCQAQEHEQCRVALISAYAINLFLLAPSMVISSTILFIHFKHGPQQQQFKRLDIVIFLTVLFSLPLSLWNFLQHLGYTFVSSQNVFLLTCITSIIKPLIYFLVGSWRRNCSMKSCWRHCSMGSCWRHCSMESLREALHRVFEDSEGNTACSNGVATDTHSRPVDPCPCTAEGPRDSGEGFLEPLINKSPQHGPPCAAASPQPLQAALPSEKCS